ncbi:MAG: mechanosensitive ion channel [Candidatus Thermoplasmatota archaeon]|nr:mechanosensitive ion channel [Candidatus Thermoplasmatota archaeon]
MMFKRTITLFLLSITLLALVALVPSEDALGAPGCDSGIYGTVKDVRNGMLLENLTLSFSAEFFDTVSVRTNSSGGYEMVLPPKVYTVSVYSTAGDLLNRSIHRLENGQWLNVHLNVDPSRPLRAEITGKLLDRQGDAIRDANVLFKRADNLKLCCNLTTDRDGKFETVLEPGVYILEVMYEGELSYEEGFAFKLGREYEIEVRTNISVDRPFLTFEDVTDFISEQWVSVIVLLVVILVILLLYLFCLGILGFLRKRKFGFTETDWFEATKSFLNRIAILGVVLILSWRLSLMFNVLEDSMWAWMKQLAGPAAGIILTLFVYRLLILGNTSLWEWFRKKKEGGGFILPKQFVSYFAIILRYIIVGISVATILLLALIALGMREKVGQVIGDFLSRNGGKIGFLVILVIAAFFIKKFIDLFFKELGSRSSKMGEQIVNMTKKGTTGLVYFIITMIFLYTLLSIGGLGDIGTTFILVISMIVGLVVSFAATGSIGNMLSGLVLISMRPFEVGDRIMIEETIGTVQKIGIMFTTLKDLEERLIEIPNNNILSTRITNFTRSAADEGFAVVVDVGLGYDLSPKTIRPLLKRAALTSPGVQKEPVPKVIVREFQDHCVVYRLRAYINDPQKMLFIRSSVMESILMIFHEEGLEVMSPLQHIKVEGRRPTREELMSRAHPEQKIEEAAAGGLLMFDSISGNG